MFILEKEKSKMKHLSCHPKTLETVDKIISNVSTQEKEKLKNKIKDNRRENEKEQKNQ